MNWFNQTILSDDTCMQCHNHFNKDTRRKEGIRHERQLTTAKNGEKTVSWITGRTCTKCAANAGIPSTLKLSAYTSYYPQRKPDRAMQPTTESAKTRPVPEFSLLAAWMEDKEAKQLWPTFHSMKAFCGRHHYSARQLKYAKEHRKGNLEKEGCDSI